MGIYIRWDNDTHTIIRYDFVGRWTWRSLMRANERAFHMMSSVEHEVNIIFNMKDSLQLPAGAFNGIRQMFYVAPWNMGTIVLTHGDRLAEYTFDMLSNFEDLIGARLAIADTLETARDMFSEEWAFLGELV